MYSLHYTYGYVSKTDAYILSIRPHEYYRGMRYCVFYTVPLLHVIVDNYYGRNYYYVIARTQNICNEIVFEYMYEEFKTVST